MERGILYFGSLGNGNGMCTFQETDKARPQVHSAMRCGARCGSRTRAEGAQEMQEESVLVHRSHRIGAIIVSGMTAGTDRREEDMPHIPRHIPRCHQGTFCDDRIRGRVPGGGPFASGAGPAGTTVRRDGSSSAIMWPVPRPTSVPPPSATREPTPPTRDEASPDSRPSYSPLPRHLRNLGRSWC